MSTTYRIKCKKCGKFFDWEYIDSGRAKGGRNASHYLTPEKASEMGRLSAQKRKDKQDKDNNE